MVPVLAERGEIPTSRYTGHRRRADARSRHRSQRMANRTAVSGGFCRRPATAVEAAAVLAPVTVAASPTPTLRVSSRGPRPAPDRRATFRLRRAVAVGALAVVVVCSWIVIRTALGSIGGGPLATTGAPGGGRPAAVRVWTVRPGDTLWSIAEAVDPGGDVRPLVDRLADETRGTAIYPGETIGVPGR
jgi:hypothetical protein